MTIEVVGAGPSRSVPIRYESGVIMSKSAPSVIGGSIEDDDLEGTHQNSVVDLFVILGAGVMVDLGLIVLRIIQESNQFAAVTMG